MSKELTFLTYKNSSVRYLSFGKGDKLLIALHGFADNGAAMFPILESVLGEQYTVYAIDLPYHQETIWQEKYYYKKDIATLIQMILDKEIKTRFELMGYSMGGRVALGLLPQFADQLDRLFLLASDGLPEGKIIHAHIMPLWFRKMIGSIVERPNLILKFMNGLRSLRLIPQFYVNFVKINIANESRRIRLIDTWISLHDFRINARKTKKLLNEKGIPVELIFGKRDSVIPVEVGQNFMKGLTNARLHIIDTKHRMINKELVRLLEELKKKNI